MFLSKIYVIDTAPILEVPSILAHADPRSIVLPSAVIAELMSRSRPALRDIAGSLITKAIQSGVKVADTPSSIDIDPLESNQFTRRMSSTDFQVARVAIGLKNSGKSVSVVTHDKILIGYLKSYGVESSSAEEFLAQKSAAQIDADVHEVAATFLKVQYRHLAVSATSALISVLTVVGVTRYSSSIFDAIPAAFAVLAILFVGVMTFAWRQHARLSYGIFEFLIGVVAAFYASDHAQPMQLFQTALQFAAGIYIMVRGLDNIDKVIDGTSLGTIWIKIFRPTK